MADFYGTPGGFRAYHTARGTSVTDFDDDADITAALLVASEWLDGRYRSSFNGLKVGQRAQVREWPRTGASDAYNYVIASNVVPVEVENATYELAYKQLITPGSLIKDWTPAKYKSVSISGAIAVQYAQFNNAYDIQTRFAVVDQILSGLLNGSDNDAAGSLSGPVSRV